jgi:arylsulfatase A-like enzyme
VTARAPGRRPNVVFILTDDQGYGDLGCHGNQYIKTPHLDRLHAESVRLTNFHVSPTCSPTRAALMTGHYANSTGVWHTIGGRSLLRRDERTLGDYFSAAGYATGLFGKWHLGDAPPYRPEDRGFQEVVSHGGGGVGNTPDYWGNDYADDHYRRSGAWEPFDGYCTDVWFREGLRFIQRHKDEPFVCYIATNAPHLPHVVPDRFLEPYRDLVRRDPAAAAFLNYPKSEEMLRFYAMVTCIDEDVGALRAALDDWGLADDTILIFMTDNGSAGGLVLDRDRFVIAGHNAGMRAGKGSPYEGGHRVPFFLHWPAGHVKKGADVNTLAGSIDFLPTLLDLCGVTHDTSALHGRSLAPLLRDDPAWEARTLVTDSQRLLRPLKWRQSCVMRQDPQREWRLINGRALYDLRTDPEQRHDVAAEHPQTVAQLRTAYDAWWDLVAARIDEPIPIPVGGPDTNTVCLTSHDWRRDPGPDRITAPEASGDDARAVWNQSQVRQGIAERGHWEVEILRPGAYRIELRRWPREANLPLTAGLPGAPTPYPKLYDGYGGGAALPITHATVRFGDSTREIAVAPDSHFAEFVVEAAPGVTELEAWFTGAAADGQWSTGAYYAYVEYAGGPPQGA